MKSYVITAAIGLILGAIVGLGLRAMLADVQRVPRFAHVARR